jgi:integrase
MAATEPIRDKKKVKELMDYYKNRGQIRNYVLIVLGIYTALRISDLLRLRWEDVYDFESNGFRDTFSITENKTGKSKTVALNKGSLQSLRLYKLCKPISPEEPIFASEKNNSKAISRVQAYRIIRAAASAIGVRASCHSLRKTFGYHAWRGGVAPILLMEIYQHSSYNVTRRYLGISQDDKNWVYAQIELII